jgi:hypothetical protein
MPTSAPIAYGKNANEVPPVKGAAISVIAVNIISPLGSEYFNGLFQQ